VDLACPVCSDQVEIGFVPGSRVYCAYDATPASGAMGSSTRSFTAPAAPGLYDLRFNLGQNYSCAYMGASDWWNGPPPDRRRFGAVCVVP
jgi:hypothetical protein